MAVSAIFLSYFLFHSWSGRYGIDAAKAMAEDKIRLEYELVRLKEQRVALESRVRLLRDGTLERDMLDEQARQSLNLARPDEIVILR
ncbi:MAG: septum formation initiator family protein [Rhizobiaceae bacterium]